jgi:hypothetical protein
MAPDELVRAMILGDGPIAMDRRLRARIADLPYAGQSLPARRLHARIAPIARPACAPAILSPLGFVRAYSGTPSSRPDSGRPASRARIADLPIRPPTVSDRFLRGRIEDPPVRQQTPPLVAVSGELRPRRRMPVSPERSAGYMEVLMTAAITSQVGQRPCRRAPTSRHGVLPCIANGCAVCAASSGGAGARPSSAPKSVMLFGGWGGRGGSRYAYMRASTPRPQPTKLPSASDAIGKADALGSPEAGWVPPDETAIRIGPPFNGRRVRGCWTRQRSSSGIDSGTLDREGRWTRQS